MFSAFASEGKSPPLSIFFLHWSWPVGGHFLLSVNAGGAKYNILGKWRLGNSGILVQFDSAAGFLQGVHKGHPLPPAGAGRGWSAFWRVTHMMNEWLVCLWCISSGQFCWLPQSFFVSIYRRWMPWCIDCACHFFVQKADVWTLGFQPKSILLIEAKWTYLTKLSAAYAARSRKWCGKLVGLSDSDDVIEGTASSAVLMSVHPS